jgi:hypothetical protein
MSFAVVAPAALAQRAIGRPLSRVQIGQILCLSVTFAQTRSALMVKENRCTLFRIML